MKHNCPLCFSLVLLGAGAACADVELTGGSTVLRLSDAANTVIGDALGLPIKKRRELSKI